MMRKFKFQKVSAECIAEILYNPLNLKPGEEVWVATCEINKSRWRVGMFVDQAIIDTKTTDGRIHVRSPIHKPGYGFDPTYFTYNYAAAITRNQQDAIRWIEREIKRLRKILSPSAMEYGDKKYAQFTKTLSSREILSAEIDNGEIECHEFPQR